MRVVRPGLGWKYAAAVLGLLVLAVVAIDPAFRENPLLRIRLNIGNFFTKNLDLTGIHPGSVMRTLGAIGNLAPKSASGAFPAALDSIHISVKFRHLDRIKKERDEAVRLDYLWRPQSYPAKIEYRGRTLRASIRLKGDIKDHWSTPDRWSFRVRLKDGETIAGMSRFSLHKPTSRQIPDDMVFQAWMRAMGNLAPRHEFLRVSFNGDYWGVMNAEEHMSKHFLELAGRKEAPLFRIATEDDLILWRMNWGKHAKYPRHHLGPYDVNLYNDGRYAGNRAHLALFTYAVQAYRRFLAGQLPIENLIDVDSFSRALVAALVWQKVHVLATANMRLYLNPYTLKIEPVTTDQPHLKSMFDDGYDPYRMIPGHELFQALVRSPVFFRRFAANLEKVRQAVPAVRAEQAKLCSIFPLDCPEFDLEAFDANFRKVESEGAEFVRRASADFEQSLKPDPAALANARSLPVPPGIKYPRHVIAEYFASGRLELWNLLGHDIVVEEISLKCRRVEDCAESRLAAAGFVLKTGFDNVFPIRRTVDLPAGLDLNRGRRIEIVTRLGNEVRREPVTLTRYDGIDNPFLVRAAAVDDLAAHPYLEVDGADLKVKPGDWRVETPLVVGPGRRLVIGPGTTLRFAADAYILSHGPILANGTAARPIRLTGAGQAWKGVYVVESEAASELTHVEIADTRAFEDGLLRLSGGVTFYRSAVTLDNVVFAGTVAEDALNIVESAFTVRGSRFADTDSDAFDSDFSNGSLTTTAFAGIAGDGLDTSGSVINGAGLAFSDIGDKAVSVGEASTVELADIRVERAGAAVVSKDGSRFVVTGFEASDSELFDGMVYVKKPAYGPAVLVVTKTASGPGAFFNQTGNDLSVNGKAIAGRDLDVDALYETGPMSKTGQAP